MSPLKYLFLAGLLGAAVSAQAAPVTYQLDPNHTMVLFSWNHFGYSNPTADLGLGEGTIVFDEQHPAQSSVEVTLPLARLDTHVAALDEHLKKADFFDAAKYPVVTFKSSKVEPLGDNKFKVTGALTVHGVTRPVVLDAPDAAASLAFRAIADRVVEELLPPVEMAGCTARMFELTKNLA